jgi:hypothetical protein
VSYNLTAGRFFTNTLKDNAENRLMDEFDHKKLLPISVVRYGMGKEIQLYPDELVMTSREEGKELQCCWSRV